MTGTGLKEFQSVLDAFCPATTRNPPWRDRAVIKAAAEPKTIRIRVFVGISDYCRNGFRNKLIVAVKDRNPFAARFIHTAVTCWADAHVPRLREQADARVIVTAHCLLGFVCRAIVNDIDFEIPLRLREAASDGALHEPLAIVNGNDNGYLRHSGYSIVCGSPRLAASVSLQRCFASRQAAKVGFTLE
jgi:hypothetical protein